MMNGEEEKVTNEQILKKVIEKARFNLIERFNLPQPQSAGDDLVYIHMGWDLLTNELGYSITYQRSTSFIPYQRIIFSHDFAKAFWGEKTIPYHNGLKIWEFNLQQMVLEKEPLKYLERFL